MYLWFYTCCHYVLYTVYKFALVFYYLNYYYVLSNVVLLLVLDFKC